jgi:hypothetical protein
MDMGGYGGGHGEGTLGDGGGQGMLWGIWRVWRVWVHGGSKKCGGYGEYGRAYPPYVCQNALLICCSD